MSPETGLECLHRSGIAHELYRGMNPVGLKEMDRILWEHLHDSCLIKIIIIKKKDNFFQDCDLPYKLCILTCQTISIYF